MKRWVCAIDIRLESGRSYPVEKGLLVVTGCGGNLLIDEIPEEHNPIVRGAGAFEHTAFLIMQLNFCNLIFISFFILFYIWPVPCFRWENCTVRMKIWSLSCNLSKWKQNICCVIWTRTFRNCMCSNNYAKFFTESRWGDVRTIPLVKCSRTLEVLWTEYEFGVNGNKAAKFFTAWERGKVKYLYSLRKPFWTIVEKMIRYGYTHASVIEKIESVYANGITQILREIDVDSRRGGHPSLQYSWLDRWLIFSFFSSSYFLTFQIFLIWTFSYVYFYAALYKVAFCVAQNALIFTVFHFKHFNWGRFICIKLDYFYWLFYKRCRKVSTYVWEAFNDFF